jgi:F0F1-type ATP synthase epsilon subunit
VSKFPLKISSLKRTLFNGETDSVYLDGDEGEFELLAFHHPILAALPEGAVKVSGHIDIRIRAGVVLFEDNKCTIIVEEGDQKADFKAHSDKHT